MGEIFLYLIPGVIGYKLFTVFYNQGPEDSETNKIIKNFVLLTVLSALTIVIGITIISNTIKLTSKLSVFNLSTLLEFETGQTILLLFAAVIIPFNVWGIFLKLITRIFSNGSYGSNTYTREFTRISMLVKPRKTKVGKALSNIVMWFKGNFISKWIQSFKKFNIITAQKKYNRPIIVIKNKVKVLKGQVISHYGVPWEYKEMCVSTKKNKKNFDGNEKKIYEYYDFENDIKIEVYDHYNEREKLSEPIK